MLGLVAFTPYLTRKTEQFGASIPADLFDDLEIRRIWESTFSFLGFLLTRGKQEGVPRVARNIAT